MILDTAPAKIDGAMLQQFDEFLLFLAGSASRNGAAAPPPSDLDASPSIRTPEEQIDAAGQTLTEALRDALLARVIEVSPAFFEKLIVDLLIAMGYGGSQADAGERLGGTADGGIDGVIREGSVGP